MSDSAVYVLKSILFPFCHYTHLRKNGFTLAMGGEGGLYTKSHVSQTLIYHVSRRVVNHVKYYVNGTYLWKVNGG